jgi:hypothetical protein
VGRWGPQNSHRDPRRWILSRQRSNSEQRRLVQSKPGRLPGRGGLGLVFQDVLTDPGFLEDHQEPQCPRLKRG